jgi:GABA permease
MAHGTEATRAGPPELQRGLQQRHLTMIAIGGVIGAGLFVGSGVVINDVGPAAFLTYAATGVLIVMVMRMLGEMATANPSTGSFAHYAAKALGGWAGFAVAWLYWYFWVIVVGFEAVAGAKILTRWIDAPLWILALALMTLMTATNLFSVRSYGEFEYWFAGIKVLAICVFIGLGILFVAGLWPGRDADLSNLTDVGGFLPNGGAAVFSSIVVVIFSMVGAEIATIAAAESNDPERAIARATNSVVLRIAVFYVGSVFLLAAILPWNSTELGASPYVSAFEEMGIPGAADVMNAVVLTAVLSCLNSGLYTASRMIFVLAARRQAPVGLVTVNTRGVPVRAILFSSVIGFLCVIAAYVSPDTVFLFLLNSSGAIILFVYLIICVSQFVLRRRTPDTELRVKMWFFPVLTLLTIAAMIAFLIAMGLDDDARPQLLLSLASLAVVLVLYAAIGRRGPAQPVDDAAEAAEPDRPRRRVLIVANETVGAQELMAEIRRFSSDTDAEFFVCVPANPVDTGQAERNGPVWMWEATVRAAQERLDGTLAGLRSKGLRVDGALGDFRPLVALDHAVQEFQPDGIVISTHPEGRSLWLRHDLVARARASYDVPVRHIVAHAPAGAVSPTTS